MLSKSAKQLLKENPELCKEISDAHTSMWFLESKNKTMDELWRELVKSNTEPERDWEIVSAIRNGDSAPRPYNSMHESYWEQITFKIHSVKRKSDGEIFSVGDKTNYGIIESFSTISASGMNVRFTKPISDSIILKGCSFMPIETIKKSKPLFTTSDGVNVFEGDTVYFVNEYFEIIKHIATKEDSLMITTYFSTLEAAEMYCLKNKPLLSFKEISDVCFGWSNSVEYMKIILELAKQKLKK